MSCITEILKLKGDKEVLLPLDSDGKPWVAVEGGGKYKDYEYLIVLNQSGHRCGYVAIPSGHKYDLTPLEEREFMGRKREHYDYDSLDINCHGGLTFMERNHSLKKLLSTPCNDFWIGFDCGHCWDHSDVEAFTKYFGEEEAKEKKTFFDAMNLQDFEETGSVKTYQYVEAQCQSIIDQLIEKAA